MRPGERVVVGCSGGPDSVAMTHALAQLAPELRLKLLVCAVDHQLRPEAVQECALVQALADRLALPFRRLIVEVPPGGPGLMASAREARYGALLGLGAEGFTRFAVGHTRDDQAETVLARICRGSGLTGLAGIAARRRDGVVRPLIDCDRGEVQAHLQHHKLQTAVDPTNDDPRFTRTRIRADALPALQKLDPAVVRHLCEIADDTRSARAFLRSRARRLLERARHRDEGLRAEPMRRAPRAVRRHALRRWATQLGANIVRRSHVDQMETLLRQPGEVWLGAEKGIRSDGEVLTGVQRAPGPEKDGTSTGYK